MALLLGCIADDFTGATDLASQLARSGFPVVLHLGVPSITDVEGADAPFQIIALKCRTIAPDDAVAQCRAALAWLKARGASRFFWKYCSTFDSTAQGNIGPVAEALMADVDVEQTIYCPAFPENGRRVFMGHLFVGEQPLHESPMKDHPLTPMRDSNLMRLLAPQVKGQTGVVTHPVVMRGSDAIASELAQLRTKGVAHVVVDAVSQIDLASIAAATEGMGLITGGSALAQPLPNLYVKQGILAAARVAGQLAVPTGDRLVLAGSCSAMTRAQVAHYLPLVPHLKLDAVSLSRDGVGPALDWLRVQPSDKPRMIYATASPEEVLKAQDALGVARAGEVVEHALAALAQEAYRLGTRAFVVAGGETSGAVTQALGATSLRLGPEIAPGVPWTTTRIGGAAVALALKSGNFGAADFFERSWSMLDRMSMGGTSV